MDPYLFLGVVLPERAQLSFDFSVNFFLPGTEVTGLANVSIILNQVAVSVTTDHEWDIFDLRNLVKNIVQNHLAMAGYLLGYAYDLEITRILNKSREVNFVFGIEIPCLNERGNGINIQNAFAKLREKSFGKNGVFLNRCFADLMSSMKHADDTGFYCYRAIESLRHHCAAVHGLNEASKNKQWEKFRDVSVCKEEDIRKIKLAADPLRHGEAFSCTGEERAALFLSTWDIVDGYLKFIKPEDSAPTQKK